jgi:serine/threonine protein kinase
VDFGLAQIYESRARSFRLSDEDEEMHVQRTVDYAALEKAANVKSGDTRSDIFFLGCVLFEMLTGRSPSPVTHRSERGNPRRFQNIEPMKAEEVNAPPIVFRLVETMMQLDPAKRYQTPKLLVEAIKKARQELEGGVSDGQLIVERPAVSIFVVEADERLQDTIRDKLKKLGYKVFIAKDPARALERFYQHPFEGLIIDAGTTGREGAMTFKELMERARLRQLPLRGILILSESQADVASEFLPTPSIAILIRPLKLGQLVHKVEDFWPRTPQASATKEPDSAPAAD